MLSPMEIGRTLRVATEARRTGLDEIVKASELVEVRPARGQHLSLASRKALNLMIQTAAGEAWRPGDHRVSKKTLRRSHESNDRLDDILREIGSTILEIRHTIDGKPGTLRVPILSASFEPDDNEDSYVTFRFTDEVRALLASSETYAALETKVVLAFKSKYSLALYELGAQLSGRRDPVKTYTVDDLRQVVGVPPKAMTRWQDFRRYVLELAAAEINQLAPFDMTFTPIKNGRSIERVELQFWRKGMAKIVEAKTEIDRHSIGRKARREGKVDKVAIVPALPPLRLTGIPGVPAEDIERLMKAVKRPQDVIARAMDAEKATPGSGREVIQAALTD
jgi:hypothetical protein